MRGGACTFAVGYRQVEEEINSCLRWIEENPDSHEVAYEVKRKEVRQHPQHPQHPSALLPPSICLHPPLVLSGVTDRTRRAAAGAGPQPALARTRRWAAAGAGPQVGKALAKNIGHLFPNGLPG